MLDGTTRVGPYMILCEYGSCTVGCDQEPMQAVVWRKLIRNIAGLLMS